MKQQDNPHFESQGSKLLVQIPVLDLNLLFHKQAHNLLQKKKHTHINKHYQFD